MHRSPDGKGHGMVSKVLLWLYLVLEMLHTTGEVKTTGSTKLNNKWYQNKWYQSIKLLYCFLPVHINKFFALKHNST